MAPKLYVPVEITSSNIHSLQSKKMMDELQECMQLILKEVRKDIKPSESILDYIKRKKDELKDKGKESEFEDKWKDSEFEDKGKESEIEDKEKESEFEDKGEESKFQDKGKKRMDKYLEFLNSHQKRLIQTFPDVSSFEGNESLESYFTELKNWSNELCFDGPQYVNQSFFFLTEEIRSLLTKGVQKAGESYGINQKFLDTRLMEINDRISKIRDKSWLSMDFEEYKKTTLYLEIVNYIKKEGTVCLFSLYTLWIIICPSSLLCKAKFKVEEIYTELILRSEGSSMQNKVQKLEDLLDGINHKNSDPILLLEGHAGSGKSTITKKILSEWSNGQNSTIRNLSNYDLLLYTEFRKKSIKSFKDLVCHLMPEIAASFFLEDLCKVIQDMKTLVIMDGLDELNESSFSLFEEILQLKATSGISVMVTTRPESIKTYYSLTHRNNIKTKHVMISGIAEEKRQEFVQKYYNEIQKEGENHVDLSLLPQYLKRTAKRLGHLWQLPYNLTLLVCLWVHKSKDINSITTSSELYWECYELYKSKLSDRLLLNEGTKHWHESLKEDKIDNFMALLGEFALKCLGSDKIELSEDEYKDLRRHCIDEGLPTDEMTGAFLKMTQVKTKWGYEITYSFPHKSLQDFLAAISICMKAEEKTRILKKRPISHHSSPSTSSGVTEEMNIIRTILSNASELFDVNIKKFQNVLIDFIGISYLRKSCVSDSIKIEVLNLIGETGVTDKYGWLDILDTVKCDKFVANFICEKYDIFTGEININDSNIYAFNSLLQTLSSPSSNPEKVIINIEVEAEFPFMTSLIQKIKEKRFKMNKLSIEHDFRNPGVSSVSADVISSVMQRCPLRVYIGSFPRKIQQSPKIEHLFISINTSESYEALLQHLESHKPRRFGISVSGNTEMNWIKPLPQRLNNFFGPVCNITDVTSENYINASVILSKIQPTVGFLSVYFPRCSLTEKQDLFFMLEQMNEKHDIRVNGSIFFSKSNQPSSYQEIQEEANTKFGYNVDWITFNKWENE